MVNLPHYSIIVGLGLFSALLLGYLIHYFHVPKVTGYLILGILLGPFCFELINAEDINQLHFISEVALGLIVFSIGCEFNASQFRKIGRRIILIYLLDISFTFLAITGLVLCLGKSLSFAVLLGIIGIATAPAATLLVVREFDSEGPVTHHLLILVGINNLICLILFILFFPLIKIVNDPAVIFSLSEGLLWPVCEIVVSLAIGLCLGFVVVLGERHLHRKNELLTLLFAMIIIGIGLGFFFRVSSLLINLTLGCAVANFCREYKNLLDQVKSIDLPFYIIFFLLAGSSLHLDLIPSVGTIGLAYIGGRTAGKVLGVYFGARRVDAPETVYHYGGLGMLSQAGIAIGLCLIIAKEAPVMGSIINSTVLSSVIIFELFGPVLLRWAIIKSGEVKLINIIYKREPSPFWESIAIRMRQIFGLSPSKTSPEGGPLTVKHVMRTQVETIQEDIPFDQILKFIEHSRYNQFPVVDRDGIFVGLIAFQEIRDSLYDESIRNLIIAKDLASSPKITVSTDTALDQALAKFSLKDVDFIPVVNSEGLGKLVGILTQRDVLAAFQVKK